ncbi:MAG: DUF6273 domain-containing protein [Treponemataceae bacterium]|nr:DUF6273 domain-containing protein [Treponemataceae bacterium]
MKKYKIFTFVFFLVLLALIPLHAQPFSETYFTLLPAGTDGTAGKDARYALFGDWPQSPLSYGVKIDESKSVQVGAFTYYYGSDGYWYAKVDWDYYKVEPIKWRIVTDNYNGNILLLAESILFSIDWYDNSTADFRTVNGNEVYDNNYEHSKVRAYLNGLSYPVKKSNKTSQTTNDEFQGKGFLQTAFSEYIRYYIADTKVDNSPESSATETGFYNYNTASLSSCDDTLDKIFLLSRKEATTKKYGFGEYFETGSASGRVRLPTHFAEASAEDNPEDDIEEWWLRSPYASFYAEPQYVENDTDGALLLQTLGVVVGEERNLFIENAKKYLGVPYVWGGTSKKGIDCSGLTYLAAQAIGMQIPRTAALQYQASTHIKDSERQPGDLVFFSENGTKVSHVGIYLGDNKMINAVSDGRRTGVIISALSEPYWKRTYYASGRILADSSAGLNITKQQGSSSGSSVAQGFSQDSPFFNHATHSVFTVESNGNMRVSGEGDGESFVGTEIHGLVPALAISSDIPTLKSIEVSSKPKKTTYSPGEELDLTGLVITATYSDGSKKTLTRYTTSGFDSTVAGNHKLTIKCSELLVEKELSIDYKVVLPVIGISSKPTKTVYNAGESLDLKGLVITATYYDGTKKTITNYTVSDFDTEIAGNHTLTIRLGEPYSDQSFKIDYTVSFPFKGTFTGEFKGTEYTELPKGTDGTFGTKGRYALFGDWPQTKKASNIAIDETKSVKVGAFTYYLGSDGAFYAKIFENAFSSNYKYADGTTAGRNNQTYKYFKVEPIKWRVVTDFYSGNAMLLAENVLAAGTWYSGYDYSYSGGGTNAHRSISGNTVYPNNYEYSTIRAYLNGLSYYTLETSGNHKQSVNKDYVDKGFLQTAFSKKAQNQIVTTTVDNSEESTAKDERLASQSSKYISNNTKDKIFLLSVNDATKKAFGLGEKSGSTAVPERSRLLTDFSKALGARVVSGSGKSTKGAWWLRSPSDSFWQSVYRVVDSSIETARDDVNETSNGIVPALCLPNSMVTPAGPMTLDSIEVINKSYTAGREYNIGESAAWILFDISSVIANYSDGSSKEVMEYIIKGFSSSTPGKHTITLSYTENGVTKEIPYSYTITGKNSTGSKQDDTEDYKIVITDNGKSRSMSTTLISRNSSGSGSSGSSGSSAGSSTKPSGTSSSSSSSSGTGSASSTTKPSGTGSSSSSDSSSSSTNTTSGVGTSSGTNSKPQNTGMPAVLESIEININPFAMDYEYEVGETIDWITWDIDSVVAKYSDGSSKDLKEFIIRDFNSSIPGKHTATVSYEENGVTKEAPFVYTITSWGSSSGNADSRLEDYSILVYYSGKTKKVNATRIPREDDNSDMTDNSAADVADSSSSENIPDSASSSATATVSNTTVNPTTVVTTESQPRKTNVIPERVGIVRYEKQAKASDAAKVVGAAVDENESGLFKQASVSNTAGTGYTELPAGTDGTAGRSGKYVLFGEWPQSLKENDVVVYESETRQAGSFTYYLGSDGEWYCEAYAFYFKVEPIKWRVLTDDFNGNTLLLSEKSLMDCQFYDYIYNRTLDGKVVYPNNYEHSKIRAYLNGISYITKDSDSSMQIMNSSFVNKGFLQTAFSETAQKVIASTTIDNGLYSTSDAARKQPAVGQFICADTTDKVFLLSEKEITESLYGFPKYDKTGSTRIRESTDYLDMTGEIPYSDLITGRYWWLRSPYYFSSFDEGCCVRQVLYDGNTEEYDYINDCIDVVPAICIVK